MLKQILQWLPELNSAELRSLHKSVCGQINANAGNVRKTLAAKFTPQGIALHCGRKVRIQSVGERHLTLTSGETVPITQCRPVSK